MLRLGFDVRAGERALVVPAVCLAATAGCGLAVVSSAADALFLARVGARHLGTMLAISSAVLIVSLGLVGNLADRGNRGRLLSALAIGSALVLIALAALLPAAPRTVAALSLVLGKQFGSALDLAFWVMVADRFDARQGRRLLPLFVAANGFGVVVGAFSVAPLAAAIGAQGLLVAAAGIYLVAAASASAFARAGAGRALGTAPRRGRRARTGLSAGFATVKRSPLGTRLAVVVAIAGVFGPILYYLMGTAAHASFGSEAEIAGFFGKYRGVVQLLTLATQAFIAPVLVARAGVAPVLIITPLGAVAAALALAATWELAVVAVAQASARLLDTAVQTPAERLVQNLLPREVRGRVAGFLDGVAKRAGAIVGGLLASALVVWSGVLAAVTIAVAIAWLIAAWALRRQFAELAVAELAARPIGRSTTDDAAADIATFVDERSIQRLRGELTGDRYVLASAIVVQLGEGGRLDAALELARAASAATGEPRRALLAQLAEVVDAIGVGDPAALAEVLLALLDAASGPLERLRVVQLLGRVAMDHPEPVAIIARLDALANAPVAAIGLAARVALARCDGDPERSGELLDDALDGDDELVRDAAMAELRADVADVARAAEFDAELFCRRARTLVRAIRHARAADVSPSTLTVLAVGFGRCGDEGVTLAEYVLLRSEVRALASRLAEMPTGVGLAERQASAGLRAAALHVLAVLSQPRDAARFARYLGDNDEEVRRAASVGLRALGSDALEELLLAASYGRRMARNNALELLRELRVSGEALDGLIETELNELDQTTARLAPLGELEGGELVNRRLEERIDELAHTLFLLLEARFGEPAIGTAARRFLRARDEMARARALETLDTVLPRPLGGRVLAPLDAGTHGERSALAVTRLGRARGYTVDEAVRAELAGNDRIARAIVVYALGAGGRAQHRDAIAAAASSAARALDPVRLLRRITDPDDSSDRSDPPPEEDDVPRSVETMMALSQISMFADLSTRQLSELADVVRWEMAAPSQVILTEDEPGDAMFFVLSGKVRVDVSTGNGVHCLGELGPGEPFGEMALFEGQPRTATVTAMEKTRLGRIEREDFEELVEEIPGIALAICRVLSRRVRTMNEKL